MLTMSKNTSVKNLILYVKSQITIFVTEKETVWENTFYSFQKCIVTSIEGLGQSTFNFHIFSQIYTVHTNTLSHKKHVWHYPAYRILNTSIDNSNKPK